MELQIISFDYREACTIREKRDVLPFYSRSFEILNEGQEYEKGYGYNKDVQNLLKSSLYSVCGEHVPDDYYDIRNWEDFSCPAPQYMLLDSIGWNKVRPVSFLIRNQIELYLALEHFAICSEEKETAAITVVEKDDNKEAVFSLLVVNSEDRSRGRKTLSDFKIIRGTFRGGKRMLLEPLKLMEQANGRIVMESERFSASIQCFERYRNVIS